MGRDEGGGQENGGGDGRKKSLTELGNVKNSIALILVYPTLCRFNYNLIISTKSLNDLTITIEYAK